jgi:hypothetical protein
MMEKVTCRSVWGCQFIISSLYFKQGLGKTLLNRKSCINAEDYRAICLMFDTLRAPGHIVSVMMLTVETKRIAWAPVSLHVLSKRVACWLVSVGIVQYHITHVAHSAWDWKTAMQGLTNYLNR